MLSGDVPVAWWVVLAAFVLSAVGVYAAGVQVLWWVRDARAWWGDRRDARASGVPVSGFRRLREWSRDRVTPLLEDDDEYEGHDWDPDCDTPGCPVHGNLPPERSAVELGFSRPFHVTDGRYHEGRERRASPWEADARAAYEVLGADFPSGLLARVRELTP